MPDDFPDFALPITTIAGRTLVRTLQLPWWLRYTPNRIIYLDDFNSSTLKYDGAGGSLLRHTTNRVYEGDSCLEMQTGAAAGNSSYYLRMIGFPGLSKMAVQLRWKPWCTNAVDLRSFKVRLEVYDGSYERGAEVGYSHYLNGVAQKKWQYWAGVGSYPDISGGAEDILIENLLGFWNFLRFVVDFETDKYVSLETNRLLLNMSTLSILKVADTLTPQIRLYIEEYTDVAAVSKVLVDCLCVSDLEP